jgi:hypothetical protein
VCGENILRVVLKIENGNQLLITDPLYPCVGQITLLVEGHVKPRPKDGILHQFVPLGDLLWFVIEETKTQVVCCIFIELSQYLNVGI